MQLARVFEHHDVNRLMMSIHEVSTAFEAYTKSQQWAEISASIHATQRALQNPEIFAAVQTINQNLKNLALAYNTAILPAVESMQSLCDSAARAIQPIQQHFAKIEDWQTSIAKRMAALTDPWAMEGHLGVSVIGFTRIIRLNDTATRGAPFTAQAAAIFQEELGQPVPFDVKTTPEDRENTMMEAGLNPEVISFPTRVYPQVLFSAGFKFHLGAIGGVTSDKGDDSGVFDPQNATLLGQVEHRLRMMVETGLRTHAGDSWHRSRVPGPTRQRWRERKEKDHQRRGDSYRLIYYADFMDLSEIICRNDNWKEIFQCFFISKSDLRVSLQRLNPLRQAIAHNRPLVRSDQLILFSESTRILTALGVRLHHTESHVTR